MNKVLPFFLIFLSLSAAHSLLRTFTPNTWRMPPTVIIKPIETSLKSTRIIGGAVANTDNTTGTPKVTNTTVTILAPRKTGDNIAFIERSVFAYPNGTFDNATVEITYPVTNIDYSDLPDNIYTSDEGNLIFATELNKEIMINTKRLGALGGFNTAKVVQTSPGTVDSIRLESVWNTRLTPVVAYIATNSSYSEIYAGDDLSSVLLASFPQTTTNHTRDAHNYPNVTDTDRRVTTNSSYDSNVTFNTTNKILEVECGVHNRTTMTNQSVCYYVVNTTVNVFTVNHSWTTETNELDGTVMNISESVTRMRNKYNVASLFAVSFDHLDATADRITRNLTAQVDKYTVPTDLWVISKNDQTVLVYTLANATQGSVVKALTEDMGTAKVLRDSKGHGNVSVDSVEEFFDGIVVFYRFNDGDGSTTGYTTYKNDLSSNNTEMLIENSTFFRTFRSNDSEVFGIFGNSTVDNMTDAVFVGRIFDFSGASTMQVGVGFAAFFMVTMMAF